MTLVSKYILLCCIFSCVQLAASISKPELKTFIQAEFKQQFLKQQPFVSSENVRVVILNEAEIDDVTANIDSFELDLPIEIDVLGKTVRPVTLFDEQGARFDQLQIVVLVEGKTHFVKAGRRLNRGSIIRESDVYLELLDMQGKPRRSIISVEDVIGKEAKSTITVGTIITRPMIRLVPDVKRGSEITIFLMGSGIELKLKGTSMEEGYIGDTIRVKSDVHKNKTFKGEIIDSSTVQVLFAN